MDRFNPFDPRYQLEAEEPLDDLALEAVPARLIHEDIQLTLLALDHLAAQLRQRARPPAPRRHPGHG